MVSFVHGMGRIPKKHAVEEEKTTEESDKDWAKLAMWHRHERPQEFLYGEKIILGGGANVSILTKC